MNVLAISYGKNFFTPGNLERERMLSCAKAAGRLDVVVFSNRKDNLSETVIDEVLYLHPTNSRNSILKFFDAVWIGFRVMRSWEKSERRVITAQDPFEAGLVGIVLRFLLEVPLNVQEHGDFYSTLHWRNESRMNKLRFFYGKFIVRSADSVRVVSKRIKRQMVALGVNEKNIHILSVETDVQKFLTATADSTLIPGHQPDLHYLLTVARFVPQKNITLLLEAFARIAKEFPKARLVLVGQGPQVQQIIEKIDRLQLSKKVTLLPWSDSVPALMKVSEAYVLSSNYEGWGRVLIEAQAAGLPIVTTDVGCVGEAVVASQSVEVVPVGDVVKYALGLERLLQRLPEAALSAAKRSSKVLDEPVSYAAGWCQVLEATAKPV